MSLTGRTVRLVITQSAPVAHAFTHALARWVRFDVPSVEAVSTGPASASTTETAGSSTTAGTVTIETNRVTLTTTRGVWSIELPSPWYFVDDCRPVAAHVRARRRIAEYRTWPAIFDVESPDIALAAVSWADDNSSTTAIVRAMARGTLVVSHHARADVDCLVGTWRDALRLADDIEAQARACTESALDVHQRFGLVWRAAQLMSDAGWTAHPVAAIERERARMHDAQPSRVAARHHLLVGGWRP
jgi:hypothetical protein